MPILCVGRAFPFDWLAALPALSQVEGSNVEGQPDADNNATSIPDRRQRQPPGGWYNMADPRSLSLAEHIEEFRGGLIRCVIAVVVGMAICWGLRNTLMGWLEYPALEGARRAGLEDFSFHIFEPAGGILLMMQVALLGGVVMASFFIAWEGWKFLEKALQPDERRYVYFVVPMAVLLFAGGIGFCYLVTPAAFAFLIRFNTQLGVEPQFILVSYVRFFMRLLLVFGLTFEIPLVMWFLARVGLVSSATFIGSWRSAIVIIMVIAAMVTPTPDPFNMMLLAGPMVVLYFLSLALTVLAQRQRCRQQAKTRPASDAAKPQQQAEDSTSGESRAMDIGDSLREAQQTEAEVEAMDREIERLYAEADAQPEADQQPGDDDGTGSES